MVPGARVEPESRLSGGGALPPQPPPLQPAQDVSWSEAPITRLAVGMWASRHHAACRLLLLPGQHLLVVLLDRRTPAPRSPSRVFLPGRLFLWHSKPLFRDYCSLGML